MRATSASHKTESSLAFLNSPLRRLEKVTCLAVALSIFLIWIFSFAISTSITSLAFWKRNSEKIEREEEKVQIKQFRSEKFLVSWKQTVKSQTNQWTIEWFKPEIAKKIKEEHRTRRISGIGVAEMEERHYYCHICARISCWRAKEQGRRSRNRRSKRRRMWS